MHHYYYGRRRYLASRNLQSQFKYPAQPQQVQSNQPKKNRTLTIAKEELCLSDKQRHISLRHHGPCFVLARDQHLCVCLGEVAGTVDLSGCAKQQPCSLENGFTNSLAWCTHNIALSLSRLLRFSLRCPHNR